MIWWWIIALVFLLISGVIYEFSSTGIIIFVVIGIIAIASDSIRDKE